MKRDMDLVRKILLSIEGHEHGNAPSKLSIDGYSGEQIGYHIHMLGQSGLLQVVNVTGYDAESPEAIASAMTWAGHDFLDAARSDTIWQQAKKQAGAKWTSLSFDLLKAYLVKCVAESVGIPQ